MKTLTAERARELLDYDPETGIFRWRVRRGARRAGSVAGHAQEVRPGYVQFVIRIEGCLWVGARVAWLITHGHLPPDEIDHADTDSVNNRITNLRPATGSQNKANTRRRSDNSSGHKGVSFDGFTERWVARIRVPGGKYKNLGRFDDPAAAHQAYLLEAKSLHGEFARAA